jgi:hypothetical protein
MSFVQILQNKKDSNSYAKIKEGCFWKYCYWKSHATLKALDKILQVLENADKLIEGKSELSQLFHKKTRSVAINGRY